MGNFAENLNLGNRFRPPPLGGVWGWVCGCVNEVYNGGH